MWHVWKLVNVYAVMVALKYVMSQYVPIIVFYDVIHIYIYILTVINTVGQATFEEM